MKNSETRSSPSTLPVLMYWRFPRKSAHASVCASGVRTKPGGPPRNWTYGQPVLDTLAR